MLFFLLAFSLRVLAGLDAKAGVFVDSSWLHIACHRATRREVSRAGVHDRKKAEACNP